MRALVGLLCLAAMVPWVVSTMSYREMLRGHGLVSLLGEFLGIGSSDMPNGYECGSSSARGGILPAIVAATHAGAFQGQAIGLTAAADRASWQTPVQAGASCDADSTCVAFSFDTGDANTPCWKTSAGAATL